MNSRQRDVALAGAALLCIAAFWKLCLFDPATEVTASSYDAFAQIYPMWQRVGEWMKDGELPLWNPHQLNGHPVHAAVLYGVFYPPNLLRLVLPAEWAMEAAIVLHLGLGWLFTYAYARTIDVGRLGALVAAFAFAFSGAVVGRAVWFLPAVSGAIWLPVGLIGVESILAGRRRRGCLLLAAGVSMPILAGWLQDWTHAMHAIAIYAAIRLAPRLAERAERGPALAGAGLIAAGVVLGLGLAAVQILPSFELQQLGPRRPGGLSLQQTLAAGGLSPAALARQAFGADPAPPRQGFTGFLTLLLLPAAFLARGNRSRPIALAVLGVWAVLVALSFHTPALQLYRMLPGGTWFRTPSRILLLYAFSAAALGGIAVDALQREPARARRLVAAGLASLVGALAAATLVLSGWSLLLLAASLASIWAIALAQPARLRTTAAWAAGLLAVATLFLATRVEAIRPAHEVALYDREAEALEFVRAHQGLDRHYLHHPFPLHGELTQKQGSLRGLYAIGDYEILTLDRQARFYRSLTDPWWQRKIADQEPFIGSLRLEASPRALNLLRLLSVRYIVIPRMAVPFIERLRAFGWSQAYDPGTGGFAVIEASRVLPRAYVAFDRESVGDGEAALARVTGTLDPWRTVVVETDDRREVAPRSRPILPASITIYEPTRVVIEAEAPEPGLLVLTDTFYPGWTASVDGTPAPILRANYLFRGVELTPGKHVIEFRFHSPAYRAGAAISAAFLAGLALLWVWGRVRGHPIAHCGR
jgi:hypothetical protein